jgi:hypothetical protein
MYVILNAIQKHVIGMEEIVTAIQGVILIWKETEAVILLVTIQHASGMTETVYVPPTVLLIL